LVLTGRFCALLLAGIIGYATLTPVVAPLPDVPQGDKLLHLLAFAALVLPLAMTDPRNWAWALGLAVAYGGMIELIQPHVNRHAEWGDFLANSLGAALGVILGRALHRPLLARFQP
jgi:VanZ family protein